MSFAQLPHVREAGQAVDMSDGDSDSESDLTLNGDEESYRLKDLGRSSGSHRQSLETHSSQESHDKNVFGDDPLDQNGSDGLSITPSFMLYTPDEERAVKHKFDRRLVTFVAFLYMLSFLDRSNIGNAKIAGMTDDLQLSSSQFEWLLRAFYITYICFEWMTLLWKIFRPSVYLAICVCSWGVIASLQSLATSFWSMVLLRAFLGIGEAAFVGIPFFLSFFYKRDELALRTGLFISAAPLATTFAGSLAWLITKFGDKLPIASWRVLFLVEGFPSVIVAVFVYHYIPDGPGSASYLSTRERKVARLRLRREGKPTTTVKEDHAVKWTEVIDALKDPICYLTAGMFFCCNVAFSSLPVFLPKIIEEMGYTAIQAQILSAPPFLVAFITVLLTAYLSDLHQSRSPFVIFHALLASTGYTIMAVAGVTSSGGGHNDASTRWRYAAVYPATMGFFSAITLIITWTLNNQRSSTGRGTGLALLNYIGQLGPLVGTALYPDQDAPFYVKGMSACAVFTALVALLAFALRVLLVKKNRLLKLEHGETDSGGGAEDEGLVRGGKRKSRSGFLYML